MNEGNKDDGKLITLDVPQMEGKEGYIGTVFGLYLTFGRIIAETGFKENDIRIYYLTKFLLNIVPGQERRNNIKIKMKKEIEESLKICSSNDEKMRIRNEICLDYIGEMHDYFDKYVGISEENRLGFVVKPKAEQPNEIRSSV